jgi:hypothetical protein
MAMKNKTGITSFPMTLFMAALLLTLICFLGFSWYIWKSSSEFEITEKRGFRLYELSSTITQTAEISAMSARMAVTTGDPSWEKYYRSLQPLMTSSIEEA